MKIPKVCCLFSISFVIHMIVAYKPISKVLNLSIFANRRHITKRMSNSDDTLLSQMHFKVEPRHTTYTPLFFISFFSSNYLLNFFFLSSYISC